MLIMHDFGVGSGGGGGGGSVSVRIITPKDPEQRGAQLSLSFSVPIEQVHQELTKRGVAVSL